MKHFITQKFEVFYLWNKEKFLTCSLSSFNAVFCQHSQKLSLTVSLSCLKLYFVFFFKLSYLLHTFTRIACSLVAKQLTVVLCIRFTLQNHSKSRGQFPPPGGFFLFSAFLAHSLLSSPLCMRSRAKAVLHRNLSHNTK